MINYKWIIKWMDCVPKEGTLLDVVINVHWIRFAEMDGIEVSSYGIMNCSKPDETEFTDYSNLTYEQVCGWLESALDVAALDMALDQQIEQQKNPPIVQLPLPWSQNLS